MKSKEQKREEAAERQAVHDSLAWEELIVKIYSRPGECNREKARRRW